MKQILFAIALLLIARVASADQYDAIRKDIEREIAAGHATGVAVALTHHGEIVWQEGFGWADKARKRRVTPDTPFSLASITKPFTTTALMTLVAKGRISLDGRANDYLGDAKIRAGVGNPDDVTVRMLASHSSGLPGTFQLFPVDGALKQPSMDEVIREYGVLVTPPGERYNYSNVGMGTAAHLVALKSGEDFGRFLRVHVLDPLGLSHSFFDTDLSRRGEMAQRYGDDGKPFLFYVTSTPGTGEMYASAHDLARFAMFHLKDHLKNQQAILTDAQIDELHRPVIWSIADRYYGIGWMIGRAYDGSTVLYHNGNQPGVNTVMMLLPSRDIAVVVLTNQEGDYDLLERVRDAALRTLVPRWKWKTLAAPPATKLPRSYFGTWRGVVHYMDEAVPVTLKIGDTGGTVQIHGQKPQPIAGLGMQEGMMAGQASGDLGFPVTHAVHADKLALRLKLRGSKLEGEIGAEAPIPHAQTPQYLPFWAEFSRTDNSRRN
ncbi:MAG TPA: serine hydrolase domain-containing protein [Rhodanobacteraceae bacterium]|nr:serine hydrolase domain-containing protein [Rhodanobacteraceae bacterium]